MLPRVTGNVPTDDNERGKNGASHLWVAVDKVTEFLFGSNVAEDYTIEELALESFCGAVSRVVETK